MHAVSGLQSRNVKNIWKDSISVSVNENMLQLQNSKNF